MMLRIRNLIRRILPPPRRQTIAVAALPPKREIQRRDIVKMGGRERAMVHEAMSYRTPWSRRQPVVAWTLDGQIVRAFDPATRQVWEAMAA